MFTLTIQTDGAAFAAIDEDGDGPEVEVARILEHIAQNLAAGAYGSATYGDVPAVDINGNTCGSWRLS